MQANKLSEYNTQTTATQQKVEVVEGKPMLKSVAVQKGPESSTHQCGTKDRAGNFDFAGLAG